MGGNRRVDREEQERHERYPGRMNKIGEGHPLSRPARATARNRRVFLSLDFGIVSYFSPEFSRLMSCFYVRKVSFGLN